MLEINMKVTIIYLIFICFIIIGATSKDQNNRPYKLVCYWSSWSFYRPGDGKFTTENIEPNICTHLIYAFAKLNGNKIDLFDPDIDNNFYKMFNNLRNKNSYLTTMISIGGSNENSTNYSLMARHPDSRKEFIVSVLKFLETHNFDGLDFNWMYPGYTNDGKYENPDDKENFATLIKELYDAFQPKGYVLSVAVSSKKDVIMNSYYVPTLSKYLNFINLMTYGFYEEKREGKLYVTGADAPLYHKPDATGTALEYTVEYAVDYWLKKGADPNKIVMGIPFHGLSWTLAKKDNGYESLAVGPGIQGPYTRLPGVLNYNEICKLLKQEEWKMHRDENFKVPYIVKSDQWVTYDDIQSIKDKVEFLNSKNLAGAMVWSIDADDYKNACGDVQGNYPLLRTITNGFNNGSSCEYSLDEISCPSNIRNIQQAFKSISINRTEKHFKQVYIYKAYDLKEEDYLVLNELSFWDITFDKFEGQNIKLIHNNAFNKTSELIEKFVNIDGYINNELPEYDVWKVLNGLINVEVINVELNITEIPSQSLNKSKGTHLNLTSFTIKTPNRIRIKKLAFNYMDNLRYLNIKSKIGKIEGEAFAFNNLSEKLTISFF